MGVYETMRFLIDLVIILVIALCVWSGYKKGLVMGVGGIIAIIISIYGANLLSSVYSAEAIPAMRSFVSGYIETKVNNEIKGRLGVSNSGKSLMDLVAEDEELRKEFAEACFKSVGIYSKTAEKFAAEAETYAGENNTDIQNAVVDVLCKKGAFAAGITLAFLLILIILTVIGNIPNLSFKLPNLDMVNNIGGITTGAITGILLSMALVWTLQFLGILLGDILEKALLAKLLLKINIFTAFTGI